MDTQLLKKIFMLLAVVLWIVGCNGSSTYIKKGEQHVTAGDWDRSVQFFQKALAENPDDPGIKLKLTRAKLNASLTHMAKGEEFMKNKLYNDALVEFQISAAFDPSNRNIGFLISKVKALKEAAYFSKQGRNFLRAQKYSQAKEAFMKAIKLDPDNEDSKNALAYFERKEEYKPGLMIHSMPDTPVSFKFKKTPITNVFEVLSKLSGINFIFDRDMPERKVTLFMTDVSLDRFIEVLLRTNNLAAKLVDEKTMLIYPNTTAKAMEYKDLKIRTFYLANMDAKKAVGLLSKILKSKNIFANEKMNAVVVRGQEEVIKIAARLIEANDRPPAEVLLNVEILEVSKNKEKQLGLEINPASLSIGIGETGTEINNNSSFASISPYYAVKRVTNQELMVSIPTATLHLLKQDGDTQILAKPQIRIKNKEKATIHIGERIPLRTNHRTTARSMNIFFNN